MTVLNKNNKKICVRVTFVPRSVHHFTGITGNISGHTKVHGLNGPQSCILLPVKFCKMYKKKRDNSRAVYY